MRLLVIMAFFVSGMTSLVLETLWMRMLVLVFGGTTLAVVTILTAFMGGLALGSFLAGRLEAFIKRPLRTYGLLELGVALYALASPWWLAKLPLLMKWVPLDWPFAALTTVRFLACVSLLLLPTMLMGATLPVLSRFFTRNHQLLGFDVGLLYSANTWGAVVGTLLGGFVLLPLWGHQATLWFVSGLLSLVAVGMLFASHRLAHASHPPTAPQPTEQPPGNTTHPEANEAHDTDDEMLLSAFGQEATGRQRQIAAYLIALTGATAMICQVVWSRVLAMIIGSSTYAFTLILGLFLTGLALGALGGAWLIKRSMYLPASWARLMLLTGVSIGLGNLVIDQLPLLFIWLVYGSVERMSVVGLFGVKALLAALPMILPACLMGTFFPLALSVAAPPDEPTASSVGRLYAANTLGSIIGSIGTGFVLIPLLGLQGSLSLCVALYCVAAIALVWPGPSERPKGLAFVAAFCGILVWFSPTWHPGTMSLGMFRLSLMNNYTYETAKAPGHVLYYKEGISATVTVQGGSVHRGLKVNGKADASSISDSGTQVASAALPLLLHPRPKDVVIIGWGSGMTAGAALHFPLAHLTAIEIEPAVLEASRYFAKWNFLPRRDKRLKVLTNDGRNFLSQNSKRFDVISSEPSNPWMAGTANLFTTGFFRTARSRLKSDGLHCQFIQLYELSYTNILTLLRSARSVFPYVRLFEVQPNSYDTLLVASMKPLALDLNVLKARMTPAKYKELWRRMNIQDELGWLPRMIMGEREIDELVKQHPVPLNTDDHNVIEFTAPYDLVRQSHSNAATHFQKRVIRFGMRFEHYFTRDGVALSAIRSSAFWERVALTFLAYGKWQQVAPIIAKRAKLPLARRRTLLRLARLMQNKERAPTLPTYRDVPRHQRPLVKALWKARHLFFDDEEKASFAILKKLQKHKAFISNHPEVWFYLGACARHLEQYRASLGYYQRYLKGLHRKQQAKLHKTTRTRPFTTSQPTTRPASQPASRPTSRPNSRQVAQ